MAAISKVEICNIALSKLAHGKITSLTEDSDAASYCNQFYDQVRKSEIARHPWNFSITRSTPTADATTPTHRWGYRYQLPSDALTVWKLYNASSIEIEYSIEGAFVVTNESSIYLVYGVDNDDPTKYHALFVESMACAMALRLQPLLKSDINLRQIINAEYKEALAEARRLNAIQKGLTDDEKRGTQIKSSWANTGR